MSIHGDHRHNKFRLSANDLTTIAAAIGRLESADFVVREIEVGGNIVELDRHHDQREGSIYFVTNIKSKFEKPTTAYREV